tara:strand:- start:999 stop:1223 length:225 start_codon:yes stop_codon:yes gene_type:complete
VVQQTAVSKSECHLITPGALYIRRHRDPIMAVFRMQRLHAILFQQVGTFFKYAIARQLANLVQVHLVFAVVDRG